MHFLVLKIYDDNEQILRITKHDLFTVMIGGPTYHTCIRKREKEKAGLPGSKNKKAKFGQMLFLRKSNSQMGKNKMFKQNLP